MRAVSRGRLTLLPSDGICRGEKVSIIVDGRPAEAYLGESVAAVLIAGSGPVTRSTRTGQPRGYYCGMGVCFDCLVVIDGVPNTRACMTAVVQGMRVERQGLPESMP